jgi:hypothetical protein
MAYGKLTPSKGRSTAIVGIIKEIPLAWYDECLAAHWKKKKRGEALFAEHEYMAPSWS